MPLRDVLQTNLGTLLKGRPDPAAKAGRSDVWPGPFYTRLTRWRRDLLTVTEQLAAMVNANAPMVRGLDAAAMDAPNGNVEAMLLTLRDDLAAGDSLADAMALRPRFFPAYYVELIRAGERAGDLSHSLEQASETVSRLIDLRLRKSQYWYPGILLFLHVQLAAFMLIKVHPVFEEIRGEFGSAAALPPWLEHVVDVLQDRGPAVIAILVVAINAIIFVPRLTRKWVGATAAYIPIWRRFGRKRHLAHIAQILKTMLLADVPLDRAVAECAVLSVPRPYRRALARIEERVEAGEPLADALGHHPRLFHQPFRDLIRLGETSGRLPEILDRVATLYDAQMNKLDRVVVDITVAMMVMAVGLITFGATYLVFGTSAALVRGILEHL